MAMCIWKWTLAIVGRQQVSMPRGAKLLAAQMQGEHPQVWALCDENAERAPRMMAIYGTGNPVPDQPGQYVGTFQLADGALVFHLFDLTP